MKPRIEEAQLCETLRQDTSLDTSMILDDEKDKTRLKSRTTAKMTTCTKTKSTVSTTLETKITRVLEKIIGLFSRRRPSGCHGEI